MEPIRCANCGSEFFHFGEGLAPTQCEDCARGGKVVEQIGDNVRGLRVEAGIDQAELAARAGMVSADISALERGLAEPGVLKAIRIADSLGVSIGKLGASIYWYPGEIATGSRRPPAERLNGFFSVLPPRPPTFELSSACPPVADRRAAAKALGENIRCARERRHITQASLAGAAGLSKAGLSKIELGRTETTIACIFALTRSLQITPEVLFDRIAWEPGAPPSPSAGRAQQHKRESLDAVVKQLWAEGGSANEIADIVGTSPGSIAAVVHRLRDRGEHLAYRDRPATALQQRARQRRAASAPCGRPVEATQEGDPADESSKAEIATRVAANIKLHRQRAGLTAPQLMEAIEDGEQRGWQLERHAMPRLGLIIRLAASLNVPCELITAGVAWEPGMGWRVRVPEPPPEMDTLLRRLGDNLQEARRRLGVTQAAVGVSACLSRGDVAALEGGGRPLRFFALVRVAGTLGVSFSELFADTPSWYLLPLPAPELAPGDQRPSRPGRDAELISLWRAGRSEREIADELELATASVGPYVRELRDAGLDLPYRRRPRSRIEIDARIRRRRRGAEGSLPGAARDDDEIAASSSAKV
jgi:transcriptional regulator with XRE-family HTH domain